MLTLFQSEISGYLVNFVNTIYCDSKKNMKFFLPQIYEIYLDIESGNLLMYCIDTGPA